MSRLFYNGSQFDDGTERVFVWVINTGLQIRTNVASVGKRTNLKSDNSSGIMLQVYFMYIVNPVINPVKLQRVG